ncbi:hypothetical protein QN089_09305 [Kurthia sp. YJT4]|uniref:hypothetical protein n=1 Tax=Kurthia sp. YJT4 TaxID=3049086 RepID=UPI00254C058C|nr:hypothetical protein [Kurthia sp. YJT4]WIL37552.1 hypothetical protein QN089_09305 [Kurthia sp. YJT4]
MKLQWLKDYKELERDIASLELNLERSERELRRWVQGDLAKYKLTEESIASNLEEKIEVIRYELACKMNDQRKILDMISKFDTLENKIIIGKYIEGKTLEEIAEEHRYSTQYIYNKHAQLKKTIRFVELMAI